jgi:hypothetical protein
MTHLPSPIQQKKRRRKKQKQKRVRNLCCFEIVIYSTPLTLFTETPNSNPRLLTAHDKIRMMLGHGEKRERERARVRCEREELGVGWDTMHEQYLCCRGDFPGYHFVARVSRRRALRSIQYRHILYVGCYADSVW